MTGINDPAHRAHALTFNAVTRALGAAGVFVPLHVRAVVTDAALTAVAGWLTEPAVVARAGAQIVAHDIGDCDHLPDRDCHDDRALRVLGLAASLADATSEIRP